jgi:hypothetical protein
MVAVAERKIGVKIWLTESYFRAMNGIPSGKMDGS